MSWDIELSAEFDAWFRELDDADAEAVVAAVDLLKEQEGDLEPPLVTKVRRSRRRYLRELHPPLGPGLAIRFTFDPNGPGIVLLAGANPPVDDPRSSRPR
jgi:hypothetical protein